MTLTEKFYQWEMDGRQWRSRAAALFSSWVICLAYLVLNDLVWHVSSRTALWGCTALGVLSTICIPLLQVAYSDARMQNPVKIVRLRDLGWDAEDVQIDFVQATDHIPAPFDFFKDLPKLKTREFIREIMNPREEQNNFQGGDFKKKLTQRNALRINLTNQTPLSRILLEWSPKVRQVVKTQNPLNGELSHGVVSQTVHERV